MISNRCVIGALTALFAVSGCLLVTVTATVGTDSEMFLEMDVQGGCEGNGEEISDDGSSVTRWSKTVEGENCRIDVEWEGDLADLSEVRSAIDSKASEMGVDVQDMSIDSLEMTLEEVLFLDGSGAEVSLPNIPAWWALVESNELPVFEIEGENQSSLLLEPVEAVASSELLQVANDSLAGGTPMEAIVYSSMTLPLEELANMQELPGPCGIEFAMHFDITASATADMF